MDYKILESVLLITDKEEKQKIMADYLEHVLFKNWFLRMFCRMKQEAYKIAEDVIFLIKKNNQNEINEISNHNFISTTIKKEKDDIKKQELINIHHINNVINKYKKYIEISFILKNIDILIRSERRRNIIQVILCIFTAMCALIGTIIGGILVNTDWIKTFFK